MGRSTRGRTPLDLFIVRIIFVLIVGLACFKLHPFGLDPLPDLAVGLAIGLSIVLFEFRLRAVSLKRLIGAAIGSILGIIGAYLFSLVIRNSVPPGPTQSFLQISRSCCSWPTSD